jgi:hypothetical protein
MVRQKLGQDQGPLTCQIARMRKSPGFAARKELAWPKGKSIAEALWDEQQMSRTGGGIEVEPPKLHDPHT